MDDTILHTACDLPSALTLIQDLQKTLREKEETIKLIGEQYDRLQRQILELNRQVFGQKSEKYDPNQLSLFDQQSLPVETAPEVDYEDLTFRRKKPQRKREGHHNIPDDLPRQRIEHILSEEERICPCGCGQLLKKIGEVITPKLAYKPAELYVIEHACFKYAGCPYDKGILQAKLPSQPIEKSLADASLITQVAVEKYEFHCPLHRQVKRFHYQHITLPETTLYDWIKQTAVLLTPLVRLLKQDVLHSPKIHTDDTTAKVRVKGEKKAKTGRLWIYIGCGGVSPPAVVYDYTATRSQQGPMAFLEGYKGYLQADAYSGYDVLFDEKQTAYDIVEVACWMHARRGFYKIVANSKKPGAAHQALSFIQKLYRIEEDAKSMDDVTRKAYRQEHAIPLLNQLNQWLKVKINQALPKSPLYQAVQYCLNHWQALIRYCDEGMLSIDNGAAERGIRPIALGRNNWVAFGSHHGGEIAAIFYSLIETCKIHQVNTFTYLTDVIARIAGHPNKKIKELLPYHWKANQATVP